MPNRILIGAAFAALLAVTWPAPAARLAAQQNSSVCNIETAERIVAVGDVHGGYDQLVAVLRAAGIVNNRGRWSAGRTVFVQTGDVVDRGPESKRALDLLRRLERDAERDGGRVYALLGNHEVMRMVGDWRYISEGEYEEFRTIDSPNLRDRVLAVALENAGERARRENRDFDERNFRDQFLKQFPPGAWEMQQAFGPMGDYGRWVRSHDTVIRINGIVFVHGGISPMAAVMGCEGINAAVRKEITGDVPAPEAIAKMFASSEDGPLWYRGLAEEPEDAFAPTVTSILSQLGARAMVIGHTVSLAQIRSRFDGRVVQIDTGLLDGEIYPKGAGAALEIRGDAATAIYTNRREPVPLAARATAPAR